MADLCTIEDVYTYLKIDYDPSTIDTDVLEQIEYLISAVSAEARTITNRDLDNNSYDEVFDMDGSEITLNQYPISEVDLVSYGSPFGGTARTEIDSDNYIRYDDIGVIGLQLVLRKVKQYVRVQYDAGYLEGSKELIDINLICVERVVEKIRDAQVDTTIDSSLKTIKLGDATNTYFSNSEKNSSDSKQTFRDKLKPYIKRTV